MLILAHVLVLTRVSADKQSSLTALLEALDNLDKLYGSIEDA